MRFLASFIWLACAVVPAQSPSFFAADPGSLVLDGATGVSVPIGYTVTELFSTMPTLPDPADFVVGAGGDLFLTRYTGGNCSPNATSHVYRVAMVNGAPVQPVTMTTFTTSQVLGHWLAIDPASGDIFSSGTCSLTSEVYRIPPSGVPQVLTSGVINDPDFLQWGQAPGGGGTLYVSGFGALHTVDPVSGAVGTINVNLAGTGLSSLGNDSHPYDPVTKKILTLVSGFGVLEIDPMTGNAQLLTSLQPWLLHVDEGMRLFSDGAGRIVYLDQSGPTDVLVPLVDGLAVGFPGTPRVEIGPGQSLYVLDAGNQRMLRIDRRLISESFRVPSTSGDTLTYLLDFGSGMAGSAYQMLLGQSGATPGFPFPGGVIPLNVDSLTTLVLNQPGVPNLISWAGVLDSSGKALPKLIVPAAPALGGTTIHVAGVAVGSPTLATNTWWFHIEP